jgi:hypothetical protein
VSLLSQLKDLKTKYLETNSEYLRTPIFLHGGIPLKDDPDKATRKLLIPRYVIWHGLPEQVYDWPEHEYRTPDERAADMEPEDVIA